MDEDTAPLRLPAADMARGLRVRETGAVQVPIRIAVEGTMDYPEYGVRMHVPGDTLADAASLETLVGVPIFIDHPDEPITPALIRDKAIGRVISAESEDRDAVVLAQIDTPEGLAYCAERDWQVTSSPGYGYRPEDGRAHGAEIVQRDRRYDHVALTDSPRGGERVRSLLTAHDSKEPSMEEEVKDMDMSPEMIAQIKAIVGEMLAEMKGDDMEEPEGEDMEEPEEDMKKSYDAIIDRLAKVTAERDALRVEVARDAILSAAKSAGIKVEDAAKADLAKLADLVCERRGLTLRGMDAVQTVHHAHRLMGAAAKPAARGRVVQVTDTKATDTTPSDAYQEIGA